MSTPPDQNSPTPDDKVLVVAETHSASESWTAIGHDERDEAVAIFQQVGETDAEFARRTAVRIHRLEKAKFRPRRAIFALQNQCSEGKLKARTLIARALVAALGNAGGVELVLAGNNRFADSARHELLGMVEALTLSLAGTPLNIRVQFAADLPARRLRAVSGVPAAWRDVSSEPLRLAAAGA